MIALPKHRRQFVGIAIFLAMIGLGGRGVNAASSVINSYSQHTTWQQAAILPPINIGALAYGRLEGMGDCRYYRVAVTEPGSVLVELDTTNRDQAGFQPQLVVFQPNVTTFGPALPFDQPPNTLALVYPAGENALRYDPATQTSYHRRLKQEIDLPVTGTYYLAVYDTDNQAGKFRLAVRAGKLPELRPDSFLSHWWRTQTWAGLGLSSLFFPLAIVTIVTLAVWRILPLVFPLTKSRRRSR